MNSSLKNYKDKLTARFSGNMDFKTREFCVFDDRRILLAYLGTMADKSDEMSELLKAFAVAKDSPPPEDADIAEYSLQNIVTSAEAELKEDFEDCFPAMMAGDCVIFFDSTEKYIVLSVKGYSGRAISEPPNATTIRGPREGFTESLKTNMMLIRRRIHSDALKMEEMSVGKFSNTKLALTYLDGVASKKVVDDIRKRIESIDIDAVHDSSYIQKFLEKRPYSLFKQVGATEKPDIAVAKMMEGRILIIVDNSPLVLTVPFLIFENFQDNEDYYARKHKSDYTRILRILSMLIAVALPALYVGIILHNYNIIPLTYVETIVDAVAATPFPPMTEMLLVLFLFDLLHDASVRMPRSIGLALNIVGALVLGDAAVKAGLLSSPSVIIGAISGIGLFAVPEQGAAFSLLRMVFVIAATILGIYGLFFCLLFLVFYLVGLENYGTPYMAPFAPHITSDMQNDGILRKEIPEMNTHPRSVPHGNKEA